MARVKVTAANFSEVLEKILTEYREDAEKTLDEVAKEVAKAGAKALKDASRTTFGGTGAYASGWTVETEKTPAGNIYTIWNRKKPYLPHLLEFGHAKRNGGRVAGRAHIKPIEEKIVKEFEDKVRVKL